MSERRRMVHLTSVPSTFQGRVLAARLGADGVLAELRGAVDGPYPFGEVRVFVPDDELAVAAEMLLVEEVEAALDPRFDGGPTSSSVPRWMTWVAVVVVIVVVVLAIRGVHLT